MHHGLSLDHSFAQLTLVEGRHKIPQGFSNWAPTPLVWDNIDFCSLFLSGGGTIHHTNGIVLQSFTIEPMSKTDRQPLKKGVSSVKAPPQMPTELPQNFSKKDEEEPCKMDVQFPVKAELAYSALNTRMFFLNQAVNIFNPAPKLGILTWGLMEVAHFGSQASRPLLVTHHFCTSALASLAGPEGCPLI